MDKRKESGKITRECIATALMLLMEEKDYDSISITDITSKAGVSRMAYYRNYGDKDDILLDFLFEISDSLSDSLLLGGKLTLHSLILSISMFFKANLTLILSIEKAGQSNRLFGEMGNKIYATFPDIKSSKKSEYITWFYIGAVLSVFRYWLETGMNETPEEIADMVCEIMDDSIIAQFENN